MRTLCKGYLRAQFSYRSSHGSVSKWSFRGAIKVSGNVEQQGVQRGRAHKRQVTCVRPTAYLCTHTLRVDGKCSQKYE